MPSTGLRFALPLAVFVAIAPRGAPGDGAPLQAGDVSRLACRVARIEAVGREIQASIVTVEVRNAGSVPAEPVSFELRGGGQRGAGPGWPRVVQRVPDPVHGRAGRVVPPSGTLSYQIPVALTQRLLTGITVRVATASFPSGVGVSKPPVELGRLTTRRIPDEAGGPVWETSAEVRNTLDLPVDAVFLAQCDEPQAARLIVARRLAPAERADWTLRQASLEPGSRVAPRITGLAVKRLALVDWSVVEDEGGVEAATLLQAACERWVRWESPLPSARGNFRARLTSSTSAAVDLVVGPFTLSAEGVVTCRPDGPTTPETLRLLQLTIADAFADLRRPAAKDAIPLLKPTLVERTSGIARVLCSSPLTGGRGPAEVHRIEDGVLRGWESPEGGASIREVWTTEPRGTGYIVTARELFQAAIAGGSRPSDSRRWTYADSGGRLAPRRYARTEWYVGARPTEAVVELDGVELAGGALPASPPEAPPEVRAAWDAAYRYPVQAVMLEARFEAENLGTDAIWQGARRVSGRLTLAGFTGMRGPGRSWSRAEIALDGSWTEEKRKALAAVVEDRLWIWAHRDFGGRDAFDVSFRGARVVARASEPGAYDVINGPCTWLSVREGRVVEWDSPSLLGGSLGYEGVGGALVHTSLRRDDAVSFVEVKDVGGGWIVPVRMRFEKVLGPDWGPETITLSDVHITPPRGP